MYKIEIMTWAGWQYMDTTRNGWTENPDHALIVRSYDQAWQIADQFADRHNASVRVEAACWSADLKLRAI